MALGIATSGLAKCCCASTTPSPEFYIPTSIDTRRDLTAQETLSGSVPDQESEHAQAEHREHQPWAGLENLLPSGADDRGDNQGDSDHCHERRDRQHPASLAPDPAEVLEAERHPLLSMMTPNPIVIREPLNQANNVGRMSARILAANTQSGNADVRTERMRKAGRIVERRPRGDEDRKERPCLFNQTCCPAGPR